MARSADAAGTQLTSGAVDDGFLAARRVTAQHFALHLMPLASAHRDQVLWGAASTLGLSDAQF